MYLRLVMNDIDDIITKHTDCDIWKAVHARSGIRAEYGLSAEYEGCRSNSSPDITYQRLTLNN